MGVAGADTLDKHGSEVDGNVLVPGWKEKGEVHIHIPALLRGRGERQKETKRESPEIRC